MGASPPRIMPFIILLLLMVACLPVEWPAPPFGFGTSGAVLSTWLGIGFVLIAAAGIARRTQRSLQRDRAGRNAVLNRYSSARFYHLLGLFGVYALSLYVLGWGWVVQSACSTGPVQDDGLPQMLPGTELLVLTPFLM